MGKLRDHHSGFTAIEALLIILILVIVSFAGYYVWYTQHNKAKPATTTATTTTASTTTTPKTSTPAPAANPYAGWQSYTLAKEKLSFKYPSGWTLKDLSDSDNDYEIFSGSNNFSMTVGAGAAVSAVNIPIGAIELADQVTFNGQSAYLDSISSGSATSDPVYEILLSSSGTDASKFFSTKNITFNAQNSRIIVKIDYWGPNNDNSLTEPLSFVQSDTDYRDAKLVVESMTY